MTQLLVGSELTAAIQQILAEPNARCAVAFWGAGAEKLVTGSGARVICNLRMGGTNPHAMRKVEAEKRKRDDLHAKVYLGSTKAVVASANVSTNGLALEGAEQSGWIEAGVLVDEIVPLSDWFEKLWADSDAITEADWKAAERAWKARTKPTVPFADFDPAASNLPLVAWIGDGDWSVCNDSIERQFGAMNAELERQVENGLELEHPDDESTMIGKWVLCWMRGPKGLPSARGGLWWVRLGSTVLHGGFRNKNEKRRRDVVMAVETMPPVPFDIRDKQFVAAFRDVLLHPKYATLIDENYEAPWYKPRRKLIDALWRDVKTTYLQSAPVKAAN